MTSSGGNVSATLSLSERGMTRGTDCLKVAGLSVWKRALVVQGFSKGAHGIIQLCSMEMQQGARASRA